MPRTVCRNTGLAGSTSIFLRSRLIWTSTVRSLAPLPPARSSRATLLPGLCPRMFKISRSRSVMRMTSSWRISLVDEEAIADAANGLQEHRVGRIDLDLSAQPVDLDVDGPLVGATPARQILARHVAARALSENVQDLALAVGDADDLLVA